MTEYFVKNGGDDAKDGLSDANAWETLSKVNSFMGAFNAGDYCYFKRGSTWIGVGTSYNNALDIFCTGSSGNPITFGAYGSGANPIIQQLGGTNYTRCIAIESGSDYIVIENFKLRNAHEAGVYIFSGANHNIIRNNEITNVGMGVMCAGTNNLMTLNNIHDLIMVVNTVDPVLDDYGAIGILFSNSDNEASYNILTNCRAESHDFGYDGGAFEFGTGSDRNSIHHNYASGCNGIFEIGSGTPGTCDNNEMFHNIFVDNFGFAMIHLNPPFGLTVDNFQIDNNIIVENAQSGQPDRLIDWGSGPITPNPSTMKFRNNIVVIEKGADGLDLVSNDGSFIHIHNTYDLSGGTVLGFTSGVAEFEADPEFIDLAGRNFYPKSNSPCIDAGIDVSRSPDYNGIVVPQGLGPDIGAYEFIKDADVADKNINVWITNWNNTGLTAPVPRWTVDIKIEWTKEDGTPKSHVGTYTFPNILAGVPLKRIRRYMEEIILREARIQLKIDREE